MSRVLDLWAGMTGTVLPFAGATAPDGWLLCHGQTFSRTTYSNLFSKIGTVFGAGDGSTTFTLPDIRGEFIRGLDNSRGVDASRTLGSAQTEQARNLKQLEIAQPISSGSAPAPSTAIIPQDGTDSSYVGTGEGGTGRYGLRVRMNNVETRPRNVALNHIIKI